MVDSHRFVRLRVYWVINKDRNFLVALYSLPRSPRFFTVALWGRQLYAPQISEEVTRTRLASGTALVEVTSDLSMPKAKAAPGSTQQCLAKGPLPLPQLILLGLTVFSYPRHPFGHSFLVLSVDPFTIFLTQQCPTLVLFSSCSVHSSTVILPSLSLT